MQASNSSGDLLEMRPDTMGSQGSGSGSGSLAAYSESWGDAGTHAALADQLATFNHSLDAQLTSAPAQEWAQGGYGELSSGAGGAPAMYFPSSHGYYSSQQPPQPQQSYTSRQQQQQQTYPSPQQPPEYYAPQAQIQPQPVAGPSRPHVVPSHPHSNVPFGQPAEYASHTVHAQQHQQCHPAQAQQYSQTQTQAAQAYAYQQQQQQQQQWPPTPITPVPSQNQMWAVRDNQSQMPPPAQVPQMRVPNPRAQDRLLRQSGDYSVTDAWTYLANIQ